MTSQVIQLNEPAQLIDLSPAEVQAQMQSGNAILVDVREVSEYENERIAGAFLMPLSFFEAESLPVLNNTQIIFMCAVGKRSAAAAKQAMAAGFSTTYHMTGGLNGWKESGLITDVE